MRRQGKDINYFSSIVTSFFVALSAVAGANAQVPAPCGNPSDAILEWNCLANARVLANVPPPPRQLRAMAIVHVAVSDAVNAISKEFQTYGPTGEPPESASLDGAAIGAAYQSLVGLFPAQQADLHTLLVASLASRGLDESDPSVQFGGSVGNGIVNLRANDGSGIPAACAYTDLPAASGVWQRVFDAGGNRPNAVLPCFGNVTPWVIQSNVQFAPAAPPATDSEQFLRDLDEVTRLGEKNSTERTQAQTDIARFFDGSPMFLWNQVLRQVVASQPLSTSEKARSFAMVFMSGTDAIITTWKAKYTHNFWRPVNAIQWNNPLSPWQSFIPQFQHQHPEYPSGQATASSGLASAGALLFGDQPGGTLTPTFNGVTPQWTSFSQGINDVVDARVFSGIHYRTSDEAGAKVGRQVAKFVFNHTMKRCSKGKCS